MHLDTTNHREPCHDKRSGAFVGYAERYIRPDYVHVHDTGPNQLDLYGYLATTPDGLTARVGTMLAARAFLTDQALLLSCKLRKPGEAHV